MKGGRIYLIRYIIKRIIWIIPVLLGVTIIVFTITYFTPGDPVKAILGSGFTPEQYAAKKHDLGLDVGYVQQLARYIWRIFTQFNFGRSFQTSIPIAVEIGHRVPVSAKLSISALLLMVVIGLPLGMISALKQYSALDASLTGIALFLAAIPGFVLALLALVLFGVVLRWVPIAGISSWKGWILPIVCSALGGIAVYLRMTRTTMLEVIRQDYIRTARAKGQLEGVVIRKHALKNCMIPLVTVFGGMLTMMFSGSIIIETIFGLPGMGMYMMTGITARDYPVINGTVLIISFIICVINIIVDICYAFIDPRIRAQYQSKRQEKAIVKLLRSGEEG